MSHEYGYDANFTFIKQSGYKYHTIHFHDINLHLTNMFNV